MASLSCLTQSASVSCHASHSRLYQARLQIHHFKKPVCLHICRQKDFLIACNDIKPLQFKMTEWLVHIQSVTLPLSYYLCWELNTKCFLSQLQDTSTVIKGFALRLYVATPALSQLHPPIELCTAVGRYVDWLCPLLRGCDCIKDTDRPLKRGHL